MDLQFVKMHGIGNDFVILDDRTGRIASHIGYPELAEKLCHRRFGIGGDGIILLKRSSDHDMGFRIFNSDGTEPEMCGNGMRCFARYLYENRIIDKRVMQIETKAGTIIPQVMTDDAGRVTAVRVDMGEPVLAPARIPFVGGRDTALMEEIGVNGAIVRVTAVSMGNPHAVVFVDDVRTVDLETVGPLIECHERFPAKTNVAFIERVSESELNMRVWERGAGVTLACGTGACAALVAARLNSLAGDRALIHLDGGDLVIEWDRKTNHVYMTGPADISFTGQVHV